MNIGDKMPDGTIYAGESPDTHQPMFAAPEDVEASYKVDKTRDANGEGGFRIPTIGELRVLFNNRAAIGGFCEEDSLKACYGSSTEAVEHPDSQSQADLYKKINFMDGHETAGNHKYGRAYRPVR